MKVSGIGILPESATEHQFCKALQGVSRALRFFRLAPSNVYLSDERKCV